MEQRTSVMISAILFAVVVAGSIAYLLYSNPNKAEKTAAVATPTPVLEATSTPEPEIAALLTPSPTPEFVPVATQAPANSAGGSQVAAAVVPSAPTGPAEWMLAFTVMATLAGAGGLLTASRFA
ncbi:MAG: hypothetical protein HYZ63_03910 [Candidatus Andersenbacteria bacterium]|nr:hypothetical protein [Candidatus Andersenbacteria bacterium]